MLPSCAGSTNQTSDAANSTFPSLVVHKPMLPATVKEWSSLNMSNCSVEMPASRRMCLVRSTITMSDAIVRPMKGPQRIKQGSIALLPGVLTATKVSRLVKEPKLNAKVSVCARLL